MTGEARTDVGGDSRTLLESSPMPSARAEPAGGGLESPRYLDSADGQIYTVTHAARGRRRGAVLLCGPFGVERERAYLVLVAWARVLARNGFEVMRFDYRGNGESTGAFEDMTIGRWREDATACAARLTEAGHGGALVLHGVRMGALIAAELFASGIGDGLLLWAPPVSADAMLRDTLRHHLIAQSMGGSGSPPRMREQLITALESGMQVNVDGYFWTKGLWKEAQRHPLLLPPSSETRPWQVLEARAGAPAKAPAASQASRTARSEEVDADTFWKSSSPLLVPNSEGFFRASLRWLDEHESWHP